MVTEGNATRSSRAPGGRDAKACSWSTPAQRAGNTFFKLFFRWTHSRAFRHNERLAYGVKLARDEYGCLTGMSIRGRAIACVNAEPFAAADPAGCHLIATGPSVNEIDYRALRLCRVMGVNGAIALQDRQGVRFDDYCIVDSGFVRQRPDLVARIIAQPLTLFATPLVLWYIAQHFDIEHMRCRVFLLDDFQFPAGRRAPTADELRAAHGHGSLVLFDEPETLGFSLDIRRGVFDGRTVAYTALQVLASLGYGRIFLHGLDLTDAARTPRFYESQGAMQPSHLDSHFHAFIEPSFRHAAALLRSRGVQVMNLSMASALGTDVFPKLRWETLVSKASEREQAFA
jgi:Kdo-III transferase WaaZ